MSKSVLERQLLEMATRWRVRLILPSQFSAAAGTSRKGHPCPLTDTEASPGATGQPVVARIVTLLCPQKPGCPEPMAHCGCLRAAAILQAGTVLQGPMHTDESRDLDQVSGAPCAPL
ncbi:hypothetical protein TREES_T100015567 [Tupaia chinensis]|uniref:Uncharacterized protein n=1 Tax=Tupaia chinensis TaxID=246437 RepID=L9LEE8_TUPCH|nr:hypothetical protein TREES_T100015567 [Tupaia chinensis]